ncbi:hypothetical protein MMC16_001603 [Acarospora aff. strigata]|nr:hypothetical protein [Acarospora aff. strigata]
MSTFHSIYHFPILPRHQIRHEYFAGRRLGDVAVYSRQRKINEAYFRTQKELARPRSEYIMDETPLPNQSPMIERTLPTEEQLLPQRPNNVGLYNKISSLLGAAQESIEQVDWHQLFFVSFYMVIVSLLVVHWTLKAPSRPAQRGSATGTRYTEVLYYEAVPEFRRWGTSSTTVSATNVPKTSSDSPSSTSSSSTSSSSTSSSSSSSSSISQSSSSLSSIPTTSTYKSRISPISNSPGGLTPTSISSSSTSAMNAAQRSDAWRRSAIASAEAELKELKEMLKSILASSTASALTKSKPSTGDSPTNLQTPPTISSTETSKSGAAYSAITSRFLDRLSKKASELLFTEDVPTPRTHLIYCEECQQWHAPV